MGAYKNIKDVEYHVARLKKQIPFIKSQAHLDIQIKLINTIILLTNDIEMLLEDRMHTDIIDKLILARIYSQLFPMYRVEDKIDIQQIVRNISDNIDQPKELLKDKIIDFLVSKEIDLELTVSDPDFTKITEHKEYEVMVYDLVDQLKQYI